MALNLSRNTKLFVSTVASGNNTSNTWEVPVLNGYSFSQDAASQTITLNEAGEAPVRGQKIFNTAINPASISFPTYVRPYYSGGHHAVEEILWEALVGKGPLGTHVRNRLSNSFLEVDFKGSNVHELMKLYLFFQLDNTTYRIDEVAITSAEVDFSIDSIAQITWSGQGKQIVEVDTSLWAPGVDYTAAVSTASFIKNKLSSMTLKRTTGTTSAYIDVSYGGNLTGTAAHTLAAATAYTVDITFEQGGLQTITIDTSTFTGTTVQDVIDEINNNLEYGYVFIENGNLRVISSASGTTSSVSVVDGSTNALLATLDTAHFSSIGAEVSGIGTPIVYNVPITGGSLTIENNITYLTPEELGKVNAPIGSFTGTRSITGNVTAYLNTGTTNTGGLLSTLAADTSTVTQEFELNMQMGGGANTPRTEFVLNHAHLVIPSIDVQDVLSTTINFTGLGEDIDLNDELLVRYYAQ